MPAALSELRELGVWSIGLAGEAEQSLYDLPLGDGPVALVVGSEEKGLAPLVRRRCDAVVAIPQHGTLPSLNVGVAGAVACFEVARQRAAAAPFALGGRRHLARAERAAARPDGDVTQALGAFPRLGLGFLLGHRFNRFISAVRGTTTAKKTTVAMMRNDSNASRNKPYLNCE